MVYNMPEITKITSPMIPRENMGSKNRPISEQLFELNNPAKVNKPSQEKNIQDQAKGGLQQWENLGKAVVQPLLRDAGDLMLNIQKMISLLQLGISTSDVMQTPEAKALLHQLFISPEELLTTLQQQDESSVLFKGDSFDALRDILARFGQSPKVRDAVVQLLKTFDYNVNYQNSVKTILNSCENLLGYMFTKDREQFSSYLDGLAEMLLDPVTEEAQPAGGDKEAAMGRPLLDKEGNPVLDAQGNPVMVTEEKPMPDAQGKPVLDAQGKPVLDAQGNPVLDAQGNPVLDVRGNPVLDAQGKPVLDAEGRPVVMAQEDSGQVSQKEAAQILKNNLLPLLGEVVVKYHQNGNIRDIVMMVVHNIVRVDKGTPEGLRDSVSNLIYELRKVANLPPSFENNLLKALEVSVKDAQGARNDVLTQLSEVISKTLHNPQEASPAALRQAENMLISMLQNQSALMDILHFIMPMQTENDRMFAELYVDPDSEEAANGRSSEQQSRKLFLSVVTENHGMMELSFLQTGNRVEFSMWCPEILLGTMGALRQTVSNVMQVHGYTMSGFKVEELIRPHSVAEVFPKLLNRKVGIDVQI